MRLALYVMILVFLLVVGFITVLVFVLTPADRRLLFSQSQSLQVNNTKRTYKLLDVDTDEPKSLIIALHGFRDRPEWLAAYSGLHLLAEQENAVMALPQGKRQSWNGSFCCGWAWRNNTEDTKFILEMVDSIKENYRIDEQRVYVVGFSNGGILAQKLLSESPDTFAAGVAVMSGVGDRNAALDISDATSPLLLVNGTDDNYVPLEAPRQTSEFNFLPAFTTSNTWAEHYGLINRQEEPGSGFTRYSWANDSSRQLEQHIYQTTHRWPEWRLWSLPSQVPDSTQAMWDFLTHPRQD